MTADPRDAEIARLRMELAESEAAAEGALMILMQTQAERDAALAQVAAAFEVAAAACNKEAEKQATRGCGDFISHQVDRDAINALTPADALAALSRRDAQMRAEGMRKAAEMVREVTKTTWLVGGNFTINAGPLADAILAAAEKEAGNG